MKVLSFEERMSWTSYEQRSFSLPHPFRKKAGKSWEKKRRLEDSSDRTVSNNNLYSLRTHLNDNRSSLSTFASSRQLQESKWKVYTRSQDGATFYGLDSVEDAHSCIESDKRISLFGGSRDLPDFYGGSASNPQGNPAPKNPEINLLDKYSEANRAGDIPKFFSEEKLISSSKLNDNSIDNFLQLGKSIDTLLELDKHRNQQRRDSNNLQSNHINNNNKNEGTSKVDNNNVVVDVTLHPCGVCCCCYQKRLNNPPPNKLVRERNAYNKNHRSSTCSVGDWPMKLEPLWECSIGGCGRCYTCAAGHPARCLDFLRIDTTLQRQTSWTPESKVVNWYDRKRRPPSCPQVQAHMVAAFEQSLSNMTTRLQHLTASAEQKDSELMELRTTIEALKKQSAEAGLTKAALQSMQAVQRSTPSPAPITNITSAPQLVRRHTFNTTKDSALQEHRISRQLSTDSVSSVNSVSSATSTASKSGDDANKKKKSKKGWLRSSFSKAFSRSKKNRHGSVSDVEDPRQFQSDSSTPNSPLLGNYGNGAPTNQYVNNKVAAENAKMNDAHLAAMLRGTRHRRDSESSGTESKDEQTEELRKQLREKDMVLTDIRLEALTSAHQLEGLRETLNKLRNEMSSLKQDNERLQRLVSSKSLASSQSSLPLRNSVESLDKRLSVSEQSEHQSVDVYLNDAANERDGKRVVISAFQGCHGQFDKYKTQGNNRVLIGSVVVSGKTKWDLLDNVVKRTFKEYVLRVDPVSNLGLNAESVFSYHIGDIARSKETELPELLPCGYFVGESSDIQVVIKGTKQNSVDALAFETLIPKSIVQRYVSLLTEHRRIILCGPSGTGKTYLAQKLAEFLVLKNGKDSVPGTVATFSVDHKSAKELRQYLSNVAEQCESSEAGDLPTVIILDNLHHVGSLGEVFNGFLSAKYHKCPFIIGTMNQATCSTTNLQLHHNFRWVLCANHMEPVKGFLGRFLRRKLLEEEIRQGSRNPELTKMVDWMPKVWQQLNKFLETHSSSDVTIGPRLFLSCPLDVNASRVWFTDLWNYSVVPYLLEAVREGLQLYGRRAPWEDPAAWVLESYPWSCSPGSRDWPQLLRLRPEDVGYEGHPGPGGIGANKNAHAAGSDVETDPLLNMLMRLQEAATYSSPHSNDSDSTSQDSHGACNGGGATLRADDVLNAGIESTL